MKGYQKSFEQEVKVGCSSGSSTITSVEGAAVEIEAGISTLIKDIMIKKQRTHLGCR